MRMLVRPLKISSHHWIPVLILAVAVTANLGLWHLYHADRTKRLMGDEGSYWAEAVSRAHATPTEHIPLWPPLYAQWMAGILHTFDDSRDAVLGFQVGLWLCASILFFHLVLHLSKSRIAAAVALSAFALSPDILAFSHYLWPETLHLFLMLATMWMLFVPPPTLRSSAFGGICLGLALLCKLLLHPFVPLILWSRAVTTPGGWRARAIHTGLVLWVALLVMTPTLVCHERLYGRLFVADSSAFNIWLAMDDTSYRDYEGDRGGKALKTFQASGHSFIQRNQVTWQRIQSRLKEKGWRGYLIERLQFQYFRLLHAETFFTTQLPCGKRASYNFQNPTLCWWLKLWSHGVYGSILVLASFGATALSFRSFRWPQFSGLFLMGNLAMFLFLHVKTRYMIQLWPFLAFFSGMAVARVINHVRGHSSESGNPDFAWSPGRILAGACLAVLALWLAFSHPGT